MEKRKEQHEEQRQTGFKFKWERVRIIWNAIDEALERALLTIARGAHLITFVLLMSFLINQHGCTPAHVPSPEPVMQVTVGNEKFFGESFEKSATSVRYVIGYRATNQSRTDALADIPKSQRGSEAA